jgi:hypothetical protein
MSDMRITLNFNEDQLLKETIQKKILEQIDGLSRAEISSRMDACITAKLNDKGFDNRVINGITKFFEDRVRMFFSQSYGSNELLERTNAKIHNEINSILSSPPMRNKIEGMITKIINERMDDILTKAIAESFSNKKLTLNLK